MGTELSELYFRLKGFKTNTNDLICNALFAGGSTFDTKLLIQFNDNRIVNNIF